MKEEIKNAALNSDKSCIHMNVHDYLQVFRAYRDPGLIDIITDHKLLSTGAVGTIFGKLVIVSEDIEIGKFYLTNHPHIMRNDEYETEELLND